MNNLKLGRLEALFDGVEVGSADLQNEHKLDIARANSGGSFATGLAIAVADARLKVIQTKNGRGPATRFALGATCLHFIQVYKTYQRAKRLRKISAA